MQLLGYYLADEEVYKNNRSKITIFKGQSLENSNTKGDEEIMKNIRKRTDGRWEGRLSINGERHSVYGKTQKECLEKYKKLKKGSSHTTINQTKFYNFALEWLEKYKKPKLKDSSYNSYKNTITVHLKLLTSKITDYTTPQLQEFLNNMKQTRTKELAYQVIKQVFSKALELDIIKKDVSQFLEKGKIKKKKRKSFTLEEQRLIFNNLTENTISKYILAYLMLGARLAELSSITKSGIKKGYILVGGTKTETSEERWVKISKKYEQILMSYDEPIFSWKEGTIKSKMRKFLKNLGIDGSTHKLRHTFSTNLYYLGADDNTRKQFLGHKSITVTNDIYTHLDPTITKEDIIEIYGDLYPEF